MNTNWRTLFGRNTRMLNRNNEPIWTKKIEIKVKIKWWLLEWPSVNKPKIGWPTSRCNRYFLSGKLKSKWEHGVKIMRKVREIDARTLPFANNQQNNKNKSQNNNCGWISLQMCAVCTAAYCTSASNGSVCLSFLSFRAFELDCTENTWNCKGLGVIGGHSFADATQFATIPNA